MPDWKLEIRRRLANLKLEPTREAAIVEELTQHLDDCYAELLTGGATEDEAHRLTLAELSESELLARELKRVERQVMQEPIVLGTNRRTKMIADLWQDLRYGARTLLKQPGFTLVAVLLLASFIKGFVIQGAWLLNAAASSQANAGTKVELPAPTGPLAVGRIAYHWIDRARPEPFSPSPGANREVMVYLWYPVSVQPNTPKAPYLPDFDALEKCATEAKMKDLLGAAYQSIKAGALRAHAVQEAKISPAKKTYPLLVFSPGFGEYSLTYAVMLEDLASHGYVVAAIDHPYDATCMVFPDGRSVAFAQERWDAAKKQLMAYYGARIEAWAADTRFVLDQLIRYHKTPGLTAPFAGRLDLRRIGCFGHSVGGMTAFRVCELDQRFGACMNQDSDYQGKPFMPNSSASQLKQPFLFFVSNHSYFKHVPVPKAEILAAEKLTPDEFRKIMEGYDKDQEEALAKMSGGSYRVAVETPGFRHRSFIDTALLKAGDDPTALTQNLKNLQIIQAYTRAFFDKHLKGMNKTLLDETTERDAGVSVTRYGKIAQ